MNAPRRLTLAAIGGIAETLDPRDREIIATLARVRVASGLQLQRLHFHSSSKLANARAARRVLDRLTSQRVLARLERRVGGSRKGSAPYVHTLDVIGQHLASVVYGGKRRRPWEPGRMFLRHALAITETYVALIEASRSGDLDVLQFDTEPTCWRAFQGRGGLQFLRPDAFVRVGVGPVEELAFVELDCGTESLTAIKRKIAVYQDYRRSGREDRVWGCFPTVVWLVPNEARRERLSELLDSLPPAPLELHRVALQSNAVAALTGDDR